MISEEDQKRPINPYREKTVIWSLMEGSIQEKYDGLPGWSDLTKRQIGEVLCVASYTIEKYVSEIKQRTGYVVIFRDGRRRKDEEN